MRWVLAAVCLLCVLAVASPAQGQLPLPIPTRTPTPNPTPRPTPTPTPSPTPIPPPTKYSLTLAVDKTDVLSGQEVLLTGRVSPPPAQKPLIAKVFSKAPDEDNEVVADFTLAPDGTFRVVAKPASNRTYFARVYVSEQDLFTDPIAVYADYVPQTFWRHRSHGRIEAAMVLSVPAGVASFRGSLVAFYGFRSRHSRVARRVFRARMFDVRLKHERERRSVAYALKPVRGSKRVHYLFACIPEKHPDNFGRPDDPLQTRCGRTKLALP